MRLCALLIQNLAVCLLLLMLDLPHLLLVPLESLLLHKPVLLLVGLHSLHLVSLLLIQLHLVD